MACPPLTPPDRKGHGVITTCPPPLLTSRTTSRSSLLALTCLRVITAPLPLPFGNNQGYSLFSLPLPFPLGKVRGWSPLALLVPLSLGRAVELSPLAFPSSSLQVAPGGRHCLLIPGHSPCLIWPLSAVLGHFSHSQLFSCYLSIIQQFLGSSPNSGQSPVDWGDFPFVCLSIHLSPPQQPKG